LAGVAFARFPDGGNAHLLLADLAVDPVLRRRGVGTALLDTLRTAAAGRTAIEGFQVVRGGAGGRWAAAPGDTAYLPPDWTAERVRAEEAQPAAHGVESRVAVAVHEATGEVAGASELYVVPQRPTWGNQRDTSVRAEHRGRGLGLAVKGHLYRRLLADRPGVERIHTGTGAVNTHMVRVNEALGFTEVRRTANVRLDLVTP
jgi:GNAT superfamily N-acetyltransferase